MSLGQTPRHELKVQIRWLIRRDLPEVLEIERDRFAHPWTEEEFLSALRQRSCIGMVAELDQRIVGFMVYELHKASIHVCNFAVASWANRQGIGSQMVQRVIDKLSQQRRREVQLELRESNLEAQLFFREHGFRAVSVLRHFYEDTSEDAYLMRYRLDWVDEDFVPEYAPKNRISQYEIG